MIKKYKEFILENNVNEGLKDWLASFMLLFNVGAIPLNITTANAQTKKEFIESQPESKLDAAKFVDFINKQNSNKDIKILWNEFILKNKVNSSLDDVNKYLSKDGKIYNFDKKYKSQDFSNIDIHKIVPTNYLTDAGDFIADSLEPKINNFIYDYEKKTSVEICILTVPSLNGEDKHDYSLKMFNKIGVGKSASNNGILIMVSMEDRKWQIITGYGVEGLLPDVKCSRIGNDIIKTNFKKGDYYSGIMGSLEEIKKVINDNPQDIKKFIEEQDKISSEHSKELWTNIGIGALILAMIATISGLLYKRWSSASDMMDDVSFKLKKRKKKIKLMSDSIKKQGVDEVDSLYDSFINLVNTYSKDIEKLSKSEGKPKFYQLARHSDFLLNQKKRASELSRFHDLIRIAYDSWTGKKHRLDSIKSTIKTHNLANIISNIDYGFSAWDELSNRYNVEKDYDQDKLKRDASKLDSIIETLNKTYKTSIRDAEKIINDYNNSKNSILSKVSSITSLLSKYKSAEDKINNWKRLVDSALSSMNYFKRWSRTSEVSEIEDLVEAFSKSNKKDLMDSLSRLETLLSDIDSMLRKWRRRKEDEERKRRAASSSSYSSSSSSSWDSGGSSFGGFGGGSSGGGGAGGDF